MLSYTWRSPQCDTQGRRFRGTGCIYWNTVGLTSAGPLKLLTLLCSLICHCRSLPLRANCSSLIQRGFFHWLEQGCHVPAHFWQPPSENCSLGQLWPWVTAPEQAAPGCGLWTRSWTRSQTWYCSLLPALHKLGFCSSVSNCWDFITLSEILLNASAPRAIKIL